MPISKFYTLKIHMDKIQPTSCGFPYSMVYFFYQQYRSLGKVYAEICAVLLQHAERQTSDHEVTDIVWIYRFPAVRHSIH